MTNCEHQEHETKNDQQRKILLPNDQCWEQFVTKWLTLKNFLPNDELTKQ